MKKRKQPWLCHLCLGAPGIKRAGALPPICLDCANRLALGRMRRDLAMDAYCEAAFIEGATLDPREPPPAPPWAFGRPG